MTDEDERTALEQQGEIMRALGNLEGRVAELQQSIHHMRQSMDSEHAQVKQRIDSLEGRTRKQDGRLIAVACATVGLMGVSEGGQQILRLFTALL